MRVALCLHGVVGISNRGLLTRSASKQSEAASFSYL
jgi:hypothetical protein